MGKIATENFYNQKIKQSFKNLLNKPLKATVIFFNKGISKVIQLLFLSKTVETKLPEKVSY